MEACLDAGASVLDQLVSLPSKVSLCVIVWEGEPARNKETSRLPISMPFLNIVCLMATWYLCHAIWLMWQHSHSRVIMVVADGLAPTWRQDICNHHDDVAWSAYIRRAPRDAVYAVKYAHGFVVVCFVVVLVLYGYFWSVYKYSLRLLQWHWDNRMIAPLTMMK